MRFRAGQNAGSNEVISFADLAFLVREILTPQKILNSSESAQQTIQLKIDISLVFLMDKLGFGIKLSLNDAISLNVKDNFGAYY